MEPCSSSSIERYNERNPLLEQLTRKFNYSTESSLACSVNWENRSQTNKDGTSWVTAAFFLCNAALGAGLLNYPVAYDKLGGIGFATLIQAILLLMLASTMWILVYCAELNNVSTYHAVLESMCGYKIKQLAAFSIMITCFGICVTFLIIIGDQFDRIFATFFGSQFCHKWYLNRIFTIVATTVVTIWPMSYFKRLDFLKHANVLGVFASLYVIFLNIYEYYRLEVIPGPIKTYPTSAVAVMAALPIVCFAFQTHEIVVPVYACLAERNTRNFMKATTLSLLLLFVLYCFSGTYGYLTFGSTVAPDIMQMYNPFDPIVSAGIVALIVKMITTYPPVIFCGRDTFLGLFLAKQESELGAIDAPTEVNEFWNRILITSIWNVIVLILSVVTPNITIAIGFLGSLAACNVFVFPGLCLTALAKRHTPVFANSKRLSNCIYVYGLFIITTGALMFVIILFQVVQDMSAHSTHELLCK